MVQRQKTDKYEFFQDFSTEGDLPIVPVRSPSFNTIPAFSYLIKLIANVFAVYRHCKRDVVSIVTHHIPQKYGWAH